MLLNKKTIIVLQILKNLDLESKANAYSRSLSGGMKKTDGCESHGT